MFDFAIRYLGFLKDIPLMPHIFEAMLKIEKSLTGRKVLDYIDEIEKQVLTWEGTSVSVHKFGGLQFDLGKKEIGHIHGNGMLDMLLNVEMRKQLEKEGRAKEHHTFKGTGWISFLIKTESDRDFALELLQRSYEMKK